MQNLHNIEPSRTRKGEYIGYCRGAQRIHRTRAGWATYALGSASGEFVYASAPTLRELSLELQRRK